MLDEPGPELLRRFVHGDRDAFEILFRHFESEVYRWIVRIVRDPAGTEDAVIEAFWRAYRGRARFDPSRSFGAWLRRIATHAAIDQVHAARRRQWVSLDTTGGREGGALDIAGRMTDGGGARGRSADVPDAEAIVRAFRSLPAKLQVVAMLALVEERPHAEIAEALGVPVGTVKSRLFRATRLLRKELARMGAHT